MYLRESLLIPCLTLLYRPFNVVWITSEPECGHKLYAYKKTTYSLGNCVLILAKRFGNLEICNFLVSVSKDLAKFRPYLNFYKNNPCDFILSLEWKFLSPILKVQYYHFCTVGWNVGFKIQNVLTPFCFFYKKNPYNRT